jgi:cell division septal protein FtsQ
LAVGAALLFSGHAVLGKSSFFRIVAIDIEGCEKVKKAEILQLSGVDVHSNLVKISRNQVEELVAGHRWVAGAEVAKKWPDRLTISVRERKPVAIVNLSGGLHYIDMSGEIFAPLTPAADLDYPVISGLAEEAGQPAADPGALEEVLGLIKHAGRDNPNLPVQNISEIRIDNDGIVMFLTDRPFPIRLGRGDMWTKYSRLAKVLYWLYKHKEFDRVSYIDVDYAKNRVLVGMGTG